MPTDIKEYIEREPDGPVQEERFDGSLAEISAPNRDQIQPEIIEQNASDLNANATAIILNEQGKSIAEEWQHDLAQGTHNRHDLDLYFAGKIDQHNMMIVLAGLAAPALIEALPQQIDYNALKNELERSQSQQQQAQIGAQGYAI